MSLIELWRRYRRSLVVIAVALVLGCTFVIAYTLALGRPSLHQVPVAVMTPMSPQVTTAVAHLGIQPHEVPSVAAGIRQIDLQQAYGLIAPDGPDGVNLYLCSACGYPVASAIEHYAATTGTAATTTDLHPLPSSDPLGLNTFYLVIGASLLGMVGTFQLHVNSGISQVRQWLVVLAVYAISVGGVLAALIGPALGALPAPFLQTWLILTVYSTIVSMFASTMLVLLGRWAIVPTWVQFIAFGNSSAGGTAPSPMLPGVYGQVGRFLPNGGAVAALHNASYFPEDERAFPYIVLVVWLTVVIVGFAASVRLLRRSTV
ncbi:DUF3533 domain-containing protein [Mycobacteriaceae bacterium NPDC060252]